MQQAPRPSFRGGTSPVSRRGQDCALCRRPPDAAAGDYLFDQPDGALARRGRVPTTPWAAELNVESTALARPGVSDRGRYLLARGSLYGPSWRDWGHHMRIVDEPSFAASHVLNLFEVVRRRGISAKQLAVGIDLPPRVLIDPHVRVPVGAMAALFERARGLTGEPALGLDLGLSVRPTLYGNLGFALMSAANLGDAIELTIRFGPLVTTALSIRLRVEGPHASLTLDELADFGSSRDVVVLAALLAVRQVGVALAGRPLSTGVIELALPEPSYAAALVVAGVRVRFECPVHRLVFDATSLEIPSAMHDPMALRLALESCQQDLDRLGPQARWSETVRSHLARQDGYPSLEKVAVQLRKSPRTLKRRLAEEGATFSALRDLELRERALTLVRTSDLSYAEIADRLGYKEVASFHRAFRKWTATTPGGCRRAAGTRQPVPFMPSLDPAARSGAWLQAGGSGKR